MSVFFPPRRRSLAQFPDVLCHRQEVPDRRDVAVCDLNRAEREAWRSPERHANAYLRLRRMKIISCRTIVCSAGRLARTVGR